MQNEITTFIFVKSIKTVGRNLARPPLGKDKGITTFSYAGQGQTKVFCLTISISRIVIKTRKVIRSNNMSAREMHKNFNFHKMHSNFL